MAELQLEGVSAGGERRKARAHPQAERRDKAKRAAAPDGNEGEVKRAVLLPDCREDWAGDGRGTEGAVACVTAQ